MLQNNGICQLQNWRLAMSRFIIAFGAPLAIIFKTVAVTQNYLQGNFYAIRFHFALSNKYYAA